MYELNLRLSTNRLRVVSDGEAREVQYNGRTIDRYSACAPSALGSLVIEVEEDGQTVIYTVVLLGGSTPCCFVGRNGALIFSDAPGHELDRTDSASAALIAASRCRSTARLGRSDGARKSAPRRPR